MRPIETLLTDHEDAQEEIRFTLAGAVLLVLVIAAFWGYVVFVWL
jgi:cupin superfamily acireductone dioxygenase involved in methionine salvage